MAMPAKDVESWLPTEEDSFTNKENFIKNGSNAEFEPTLNFPIEFPYEFDLFDSSSALGSPVESVVACAGTENSDDGDFLAGLTRRLTQQLVVKHEKSKWVMTGSPESTLSGIGSWSDTGISSPPTPFEVKKAAWELIYEAAGQVARLKMSNEGHRAFRPKSVNYDHVFSQINQYRYQDQVLRPQFSGRQRHHLQQQIQNRARFSSYENGKGVRSSFLLPQSAWPPPQIQTNSGIKRGSAGTGVFLPRRYGNPPDCMKKQASSTVLLPAKVVQALNAHSQTRYSTGFGSEFDAGLIARRNALLAQRRRGLGAEGVVRLPHEWTY